LAGTPFAGHPDRRKTTPALELPMTSSTAATTVPTTPADTDASNIDSVYENLIHGVGHEHVTEANVEALIRRAEEDKHPVLAAELREWQAPCG
jgi:hypothetical protein